MVSVNRQVIYTAGYRFLLYSFTILQRIGQFLKFTSFVRFITMLGMILLKKNLLVPIICNY